MNRSALDPERTAGLGLCSGADGARCSLLTVTHDLARRTLADAAALRGTVSSPRPYPQRLAGRRRWRSGLLSPGAAPEEPSEP